MTTRRKVRMHWVGAALFLVCALGAVVANRNRWFPPALQTVAFPLEGKTYRLLVADTPRAWEIGLMYRRALPEADGMVFLFPDLRYRSFYNKNTHLDLDVYWLAGGVVLGRVRLAPIERTGKIVIVDSPGPVDTVVEIVRR
jgi:uncharacterized membrane protein (UPF0127 family)